MKLKIFFLTVFISISCVSLLSAKEIPASGSEMITVEHFQPGQDSEIMKTKKSSPKKSFFSFWQKDEDQKNNDLKDEEKGFSFIAFVKLFFIKTQKPEAVVIPQPEKTVTFTHTRQAMERVAAPVIEIEVKEEPVEEAPEPQIYTIAGIERRVSQRIEPVIVKSEPREALTIIAIEAVEAPTIKAEDEPVVETPEPVIVEPVSVVQEDNPIVMMDATTSSGNPVSGCQRLDQSGVTYVLEQNIIGDLPDKCIDIRGSNIVFDCQNKTIQDTDTSGTAIYLSARDSTVKNCSLVGPTTGSYNDSNGIASYWGADNTIVNNNVTGFGTGIQIHSDRNIVDGNTVENSIKAIHVRKDGNIVINNLVQNNMRGQGWGLASWAGTNSQFINNKSLNNRYGLLLSYAEDNTIVQCNEFSGNSVKDIYAYNNTTSVTIAADLDALKLYPSKESLLWNPSQYRCDGSLTEQDKQDINEMLGMPEGVSHCFDEFVRGDVDGNGEVDSKDQKSLSLYLADNSAGVHCFEAADVNNDHTITQADADYLSAYLSGDGPAPDLPFPEAGVISVFDCTESPCNLVVEGELIRVEAQEVEPVDSDSSWVAASYDSEGELIARARFTIDYGDGVNTSVSNVNLVYEILNSPYGYDSVSETAIEGTIPVTFSEGGTVPDPVRVSAVLGMMVSLSATDDVSLASAGWDPADGSLETRTDPDGCQVPVLPPAWGYKDEQEDCCDQHDLCYREGGDSCQKEKCDSDLVECVNNIRSGPIEDIWGIGRDTSIWLFGWRGFKYHDRQCSCSIPVDLYDAGFSGASIEQNCPAGDTDCGCTCSVSFSNASFLTTAITANCKKVQSCEKGACCTKDDTCVMTSKQACTDWFGSYHGTFNPGEECLIGDYYGDPEGGDVVGKCFEGCGQTRTVVNYESYEKYTGKSNCEDSSYEDGYGHYAVADFEKSSKDKNTWDLGLYYGENQGEDWVSDYTGNLYSDDVSVSCDEAYKKVEWSHDSPTECNYGDYLLNVNVERLCGSEEGDEDGDGVLENAKYYDGSLYTQEEDINMARCCKVSEMYDADKEECVPLKKVECPVF